MSLDHFAVGQEMQVTHAPFSLHLTLDFTKQLTFVIREGPYASTETVDIEVSPLAMAPWQSVPSHSFLALNAHLGR